MILLDLFNIKDEVKVIDVGSTENCMALWNSGEIDAVHRWPKCTTHAKENGGGSIIGGYAQPSPQTSTNSAS
jgi:hypothetical protein